MYFVESLVFLGILVNLILVFVCLFELLDGVSFFGVFRHSVKRSWVPLFTSVADVWKSTLFSNVATIKTRIALVLYKLMSFWKQQKVYLATDSSLVIVHFTE